MKQLFQQSPTEALKLRIFSILLLSFLIFFTCSSDDSTSTNPSTTPSAPSLAIDYDISENFYIALTNSNIVLNQKTDFGSGSSFTVRPSLPNGLSLDITSGNISGKSASSSLPKPYTLTATAGGKSYTEVISLGISPSVVWVTNTNSGNPYQLTAFVVGDGSKQISDWTWGTSNPSLATVNNGMIDFKTTSTGGTVVISAVKSSYSNGISFTLDKVEIINGEKVTTQGRSVHLTISSSTTTITNNQFQNQGLTSVAIPNGLTTIEEYAFNQNQLTSVVIPDSITSIEGSAFENNPLLNSVRIGKGVTNIGRYAFNRGKLTYLIIPNNIKTIADNAFGDNQLTNLVIGSGITNIDNGVFQNNKLTSVEIPNNIITIGFSVFRNNLLTNVFIPDSVTTIQDYAFSDNPNLVEVSLKQSLYTKITNTSSTSTVFGTNVTSYIKRP